MNSDFKNEIIDYIKSVCKMNEFVLDKEISNGVRADVFFPDLNRAIIFYSISATGNEQKVRLSNLKQSIKLVHLWEDQWVFHEEKIRSKIKSLLGITRRIHGRETNLIPIDNKQLMDFLEVNHLNVPIKAKYKYGLLKDRELVAVMSFSKSRQIVRKKVVFNSFELLRFCNKLDVTVVGGFSKLLHHFIKSQDPDDVMTYVDCDWSDGQSFLSMGFEYLERMPVMEFWLNIKTGEREYPHLVLKKPAYPASPAGGRTGRHEKSMSDYTGETEKAIFLEKLGYIQVYNSGSYKCILKRK